LKLIAGLGNPGTAYSRTRHNIGFICLDRLAKDLGIKFERRICQSKIGHGKLDDEDIYLAKPQTFMNSSGRAIKCLVKRLGLKANTDLIVVHDELDLPLGVIRIKKGGSSAGHKGVQSIIDELGADEFIRLRIGIGRPGGPDVVDYVLDNFTGEEKAVLAEVISRTCQAILSIINQGPDAAMNEFNR
jgi:PTH1 family peptidyl-tRNA hydrolase